MIAESEIQAAETPLQRTKEWHQQRCGKATGSRVSDVIARTQKGWGAARAKYMKQLVAERLCGHPQEKRAVKSMDDRSDLEPEARAAYSFYTGNEVELVGFVDHPTILNAGSSPDGLVSHDGMIEIKCFDSDKHVDLLSGDDSALLDHLPQVHFELACTGRQWCDLAAYNPIMPEELKLFIRRIERDADVIEKLETIVKEFLEEVDARVQKVLALATNGGRHV